MKTGYVIVEPRTVSRHGRVQYAARRGVYTSARAARDDALRSDIMIWGVAEVPLDRWGDYPTFVSRRRIRFPDADGNLVARD